MKIGSENIEKTSSIKFLGVILDEHISWNDHIKSVRSKIEKLLNRASYFLNGHFFCFFVFFFYNNEIHINQKKKNIQQCPNNFMCARGKSRL